MLRSSTPYPRYWILDVFTIVLVHPEVYITGHFTVVVQDIPYPNANTGHKSPINSDTCQIWNRIPNFTFVENCSEVWAVGIDRWSYLCHRSNPACPGFDRWPNLEHRSNPASPGIDRWSNLCHRSIPWGCQNFSRNLKNEKCRQLELIGWCAQCHVLKLNGVVAQW